MNFIAVPFFAAKNPPEQRFHNALNLAAEQLERAPGFSLGKHIVVDLDATLGCKTEDITVTKGHLCL